MTALSIPSDEVRVRQAAGWPWISGLIFCICYACATWSWSADQRWYASDADQVSALVDRISEGQWTRQVAFVVLGLYGLVGLMLPAERPPRWKISMAYPLVVFVGWAMLSISWSIDTQQTAKRLVIFAASIAAVLAVIRHYDIRQIAQIAFIASGITITIGICNELRIIATDSPGFGMWRFGGTMHPNHAGLNALIVLLSSLYLYRFRRQKFFLLCAAVGAFILLMSKSRTALMAGATATTVFLLLATSTSRAIWAMLAVGWIVAAAMWLSSTEMLPDLSRFVTLGRDDVKKVDVKQLTGRTDIWRFAVMQGAKDPNRTWIGYGYETFWTGANARGVSEFVKFKISEGHNVYLDWYLELGVVGVGLYVFILLTSLARWALAAKLLGSASAALAAGVLAGAVIHGLAESSSGDALLPSFFSYVAMAAAALLRPDEEEAYS